MSLRKFLQTSAVLITGLGTGMGISKILSDYVYAPNSVYVKDLNVDGRPDLVINTGYDNKFIRPRRHQHHSAKRNASHTCQRHNRRPARDKCKQRLRGVLR